MILLIPLPGLNILIIYNIVKRISITQTSFKDGYRLQVRRRRRAALGFLCESDQARRTHFASFHPHFATYTYLYLSLLHPLYCQMPALELRYGIVLHQFQVFGTGEAAFSGGESGPPFAKSGLLQSASSLVQSYVPSLRSQQTWGVRRLLRVPHFQALS